MKLKEVYLLQLITDPLWECNDALFLNLVEACIWKTLKSICAIKRAYCEKIYFTFLQTESLVNLEIITVSHEGTGILYYLNTMFFFKFFFSENILHNRKRCIAWLRKKHRF